MESLMTSNAHSRPKVSPAIVAAVGVILAAFLYLQIVVGFFLFAPSSFHRRQGSPSQSTSYVIPVMRAAPGDRPPTAKEENAPVLPPETIMPPPAVSAGTNSSPEPPREPQKLTVHHFENGVPVAYEDAPK